MRTTIKNDVIQLPVTAAEARMRLRIDSVDEATDAEVDTELENMISAATAMCEGYLRRSVAQNRFTMTDPDGLPYGCYILQLPFPEVTSIESFTYMDDDDVEQTLTAGSGYRLTSQELLRPPRGERWPTGTTYDMSVTYLAGWGTAAPDEIKQWILAHVGNMYRNRESVITGTIATPMPHLNALIDQHRIVLV